MGYGYTPSSVQWSMWSVPETGKPESHALMDRAHKAKGGDLPLATSGDRTWPLTSLDHTKDPETVVASSDNLPIKEKK